MVLTFRIAAGRLEDADKRWQKARSRALDAVAAARAAFVSSAGTVDGGRSLAINAEIIDRLTAGTERSRRMKAAEALVQIGRRRGEGRESTKLEPLVLRLEEIVRSDIDTLNDITRSSSDTAAAIKEVMSWRTRLGQDVVQELVNVAGDSPDVALQLLQQQLESAARAELASEVLGRSIRYRLESSAGWLATATGSADSLRQGIEAVAQQVEVDTSAADPPASRVKRLVELHHKLDPRLRELARCADSEVRKCTVEASDESLSEIGEFLSAGRVASGLSHAEHNSVKRGLAKLRDGRTSVWADLDVARCIEYVGSLLAGVADHRPSAATEASDQIASPPIADTDDVKLRRVLSCFVTLLVPQMLEELRRVYPADRIQDRTMEAVGDGTCQVNCVAFLEFASQNWPVRLTRRFGARGRNAVNALRTAAYALDQGKLSPRVVTDAADALEYLRNPPSHSRSQGVLFED